MPRQPDSRQRLLHTAADLILARGYTATSVDSICEACGIKKGSFYHHFASKEELVTEALDTSWSSFKGMLDRAFSPVNAPLERIAAFVSSTISFQRDQLEQRSYVCGCPLFTLGAEIGTYEPRLREIVAGRLATMARYFESAVREAHALGQIHAPDAKAVAAMILTYVEGALTLARIKNDLQPLLHLELAMNRLLMVKSEPVA